MRRKPQEIDFEEEAAIERARIEALVGQEVPLSLRYCLGPRPCLIAIDGDFALLQFPNGARLERVPLRDLVDDNGYWKQQMAEQFRARDHWQFRVQRGDL